MMQRITQLACIVAVLLIVPTTLAPSQAHAEDLIVPVNRSDLLSLPTPVDEVVIANPAIADVYVHGTTRISVIGKSVGTTNLRIFDRDGTLIKDAVVHVTYDLPAIRKTLNTFFPNDRLGVSTVNDNIALTGEVPDATTAKKATQVVSEFIKTVGAPTANPGNEIINLTKVRSGQQVMLRVRIGEIKRTTLRNIGMSLDASRIAGNSIIGFTSLASNAGTGFGSLGASVLTPNTSLTAILDALEEQNLLKILAEPQHCCHLRRTSGIHFRRRIPSPILGRR